jgi:Domain of unknown function (DUF4861)
MRKAIGILSGGAVLGLAAVGAFAADASLRIVVTNEADLARAAETVEVDAPLFRAALGGDLRNRVRVTEEPSGREILAQAIDLDGDGQTQQVVFQADFGPHESKSFRLVRGEPRPYRKEDFRVYGRFVRERFDDFAWENDRIAHRMYGAALETWALEPLASSAVDIWMKRTRRLVVNDWYMVDDYHHDSGEGADLYSAGASRGCGGSGLWRDGRLVVSRNFRASRVLANGPIRLVFELDYPAWGDPAVRSETKRVTLDAGRNLDHFESRYDVSGGGPVTYAVGIKKEAADGFRFERDEGILRTWGPVHDDQGRFGCAVIVAPSSLVDVTEGDRDHLVVVRGSGTASASYYAGFGWDRSGDFSSAEDWGRYVEDWAARIASPLRVKVAAP